MTAHPRVRVYPVEDRNGHDGMTSVARELKEHYLQPMPEAAEPAPQPFPPPVNWGLGLGILLGAVLGLVAGMLLFNGTIALQRWDNMYSMAPLAFHVFWVVIGIALGVVIVGIGAILLAKPEPVESRD
jgi:hypothetical protein